MWSRGCGLLPQPPIYFFWFGSIDSCWNDWELPFTLIISYHRIPIDIVENEDSFHCSEPTHALPPWPLTILFAVAKRCPFLRISFLMWNSWERWDCPTGPRQSHPVISNRRRPGLVIALRSDFNSWRFPTSIFGCLFKGSTWFSPARLLGSEAAVVHELQAWFTRFEVADLDVQYF
jgi:hypothetical protein